MVEHKIDVVKKLFDKQIDLNTRLNQAYVHRNMPRVAGTLKWCQELKERFTKPVESFKRIIEQYTFEVDYEQKNRIERKYIELSALLDKYSSSVYNEWCAHVGQLSNDNLDKNLIIRNVHTKEIKTNFDPQLLAVLREVKYLKFLGIENIPVEAMQIYNQNEEYRKFITSLDYTVDSYNNILKTGTSEEIPLIQDEINEIDEDLKNGVEVLKWKTPNIDEYIIGLRNKTSNLESRLQMSKHNIEKIETIMSTWKGTPLFKRYEAKSTLLQLDDKQAKLDSRYKEIRDAGNKIHDLVKVN